MMIMMNVIKMTITQNDHQDHLQDHVLLPEPRKAFVPNGGKQLLYIRVGNKLGSYRHLVNWATK